MSKVAQKYYFKAMFDKDMNSKVIWLTKKKFFKENGCLDDCGRGPSCWPSKYPNAMEACFDIPADMTLTEVRAHLRKLGYTEKRDLTS